MIDNVIKILPESIARKILAQTNKEDITEIRLRVGFNARIYFGIREAELMASVHKQDLLNILKNISLNSIYSVQNDINKGYITTEGGNRIGIAGEVVIADGKIKNIKEISSMNIRVAHEYIGVSNGFMDKVVVLGQIQNTLIVSPPGLGKTTLLRDVIRNLSEMGYNVSVIDERGEIASMYAGSSALNIGTRTDVISFVDKATGMQMAVRSLRPDVVCTDEIGGKEDVLAIKYLCKCGVAFITTMHGRNVKDVKLSYMKEIINDGYLDTIIVLSNKKGIGSIERIYTNVMNKEEITC